MTLELTLLHEITHLEAEQQSLRSQIIRIDREIREHRNKINDIRRKAVLSGEGVEDCKRCHRPKGNGGML